MSDVAPDPRSALVVDDDTVSRVVLAHMLRRRGWTVLEAIGVETARAVLTATPVAVVFSDYSMPDGTGVELADWTTTLSPAPQFVLVTGVADLDDVALAGALPRITKPIDTPSLTACLSALAGGETG